MIDWFKKAFIFDLSETPTRVTSDRNSEAPSTPGRQAYVLGVPALKPALPILGRTPSKGKSQTERGKENCALNPGNDTQT